MKKVVLFPSIFSLFFIFFTSSKYLLSQEIENFHAEYTGEYSYNDGTQSGKIDAVINGTQMIVGIGGLYSELEIEGTQYPRYLKYRGEIIGRMEWYHGSLYLKFDWPISFRAKLMLIF